jgi:hypothetical protein
LIHDRTHGLVDGQFLPIDTKASELSVRVGEVTSLQQRIVGKADTRHNVTCAEGHLLGLRKVLVGVAVKLEFANVSDGEVVFGPELGGIERVKVKVVFLALRDGLNTKLPLGIGASLDGCPEVFAVEVRVLASKFQSL